MKLTHLTDKTLHADLGNLVSQERNLLSKILWHLREVDSRKLYCAHGCGSLFEYLVKVMKYSESQAARRVSACRLLREVPEITEKIESGEINITQMNQLSTFFVEEEIKDLKSKEKAIEAIAGKTTRESDRILDDMKKVPTPKRVNLSLKQETLDKLQTVKALKAHKYVEMDDLLMGMSEVVLEVWDPMKKTRVMKTGLGQTRYVSKLVKREVWIRDGGKCQNCSSTYALELDHITPFSMGGKTVVENLRLLCRNCNQHRGMKDFGIIKRKTSEGSAYAR